jgi:micrococcal nuclease
VDPVRLTAVVLVLAAAGCGGGATVLESVDAGTVATVVDGDTVRLEDGRRIRLVQIDAPEERSECYGREATRALVALAPRGTRVELVRDPALDDEDESGRLLRYLVVEGENVNLTLVERGAAAPYFFRNARGRYATDLLDAAREARAERRGLWGACPGARLEPGLGSVTGRA